jgi:hypothetical protein
MKVRLVLTAAAVLFAGVVAAMPASAQYVGGVPPAAGPVAAPTADVAPKVKVQVVAKPVEVEVGRVERVTRFAITGADIAQLVLIGGVFVVGGAVLVRQGRRRQALSGS